MGWFILIGIIVFFVGFGILAIAADEDSVLGAIIGFLMIVGGIVLFFTGVFGVGNEISAANAKAVEQVTQAAATQHLTVTNIAQKSATVVGNKCTLTADLKDGKLVLTGSDPAIVLTPDYVDLVCQGVSR
jgi:uncharacterized membrane protein